MVDIEAAIAELKARWPKLKHVLDRADAIFDIHQAGVSLRRLARELNCSDKTLRNLLQARLASPEDRRFARQNKISTRALIRRAAGREQPQPPRSTEAARFERTKTALHVSQVIRDWVEKSGLNEIHQMQVIEEARHILKKAEERGKLPRGEAPRDLREADIIMHCYPKEPKPADTELAELICWHGRWMAISTYYLIPDDRGWDEALAMLIRQLKSR